MHLDKLVTNRSSQSKNSNYRLAVLSTHPIQYLTPFYRHLSRHPKIDLTVFFYTDWGLKPYKDEWFGQVVKWDIPLIDDYKCKFLRNFNLVPKPSSFFGVISPGIIKELKDGNFDAVLVHGWSRFTDWIAMLTAFASSIPVLVRGESNLISKISFWKNCIKDCQRISRKNN